MDKHEEEVLQLLRQIEINTRPKLHIFPNPEPKIGQCMHCGGSHGGLPCPLMSPTALEVGDD